MTKDAPKEKIRIAFVLPGLAAGGAERVMITLMNNLDRTKFDPCLISVSGEGALSALIDPALPRHMLNCRRVLFSPPRLYRLIRSLKPDIVISTMAHMNFIILFLKPFCPGTTFIVREAIVPSFILQDHPRLAHVLKAAYRILYPLADLVISPAQKMIDEFRFLLKVDCRNHALLYNPVDINRLRAANITIDPAPDTVRFIAAGRLHPQKGFDRLINKLHSLKLPYRWSLTILGEGQERNNLLSLIKRCGFEDRVFLPGHNAEPWQAYAAADCFLLPSLWEGLPNVALESLACGTPVIATQKSGGIEEIAALATPGAVTIAHDMDDFIAAMAKIKPGLHRTIRPSLLPQTFYPDKVYAAFASLLMKTLKSS